ncbi:hypothetical protein ACFVT2_03130 [Streptomyces sp. NPDC058000]|uniref:hypothetical protein n=1 Tax=Streptomyces sp. NPDC058000 TaxID=3346299 RepID=UPI0036ED5EB3
MAVAAVPPPGRPFELADGQVVAPWWRAVAVPPVWGWPSWPPVGPVAARSTAAVDGSVGVTSVELPQ